MITELDLKKFREDLKNINDYNFFICLIDDNEIDENKKIKSYSILEDLGGGHIKLSEINSTEKNKGFGSILFYNLYFDN